VLLYLKVMYSTLLYRTILYSSIIYSTLLYSTVTGELVIKVSRGREDSVAYRQSLQGNVTSDTVTIEYVTPSGRGVTQVSDFRTGVTLTVVTIPGEEDLGEPRYQVLCFVGLGTADLIPPEAMTKLRQKHPGTVRVAEEYKGTIVVDNSVSLVPARSGHISVHVPHLCREARHTTFAPVSLLEGWRAGDRLGDRTGERREEATWVREASQHWETGRQTRCAHTVHSGVDCVCSVTHCVHWFPCSLKYCRNTAGEGEHRCGIRTCSKCTALRYLSPSRQLCSWDQV